MLSAARARLALLLTFALLGALPAAAGAAPLSVLSPLGPIIHGGVPAAAVRQSAVARGLAQATGLTPAQVRVAPVCPASETGLARCGALSLVVPGTHRPVRALVRGASRLQRILPAARVRSLASVEAPSQQAPQTGSPAWLQQAYDLSYLSQTAGSGQTIGVVDAYNDPTAESDLAAYRSHFGLAACTSANGCFTKVNQQGQSSPLPPADSEWDLEESLDLDAVSALCPNCHIILVEANDSYNPDLEAGMHEAVTLGATEISASFGAQQSTPIDFGSFSVPVVAGTGDSGYWGTQIDSYPAADPSVTAAGGTSLASVTDGSGGRGFAESAWSGAGSGCDRHEIKPQYQTDSGCAGRAYADVSADADPYTGLIIDDNGTWELGGGTSLATPLIASFYALTGIHGLTPAWAYGDAAELSDPSSGSNATASASCSADIAYICQSGPGYDGPTGEGSITGAVVSGAPGIGGPTASVGGYATGAQAGSASVVGGVYPNGADTRYWWEYGTTTAYGQSSGVTDVGAGSAPVTNPSTLPNLSPRTTYHYRLVAANRFGTTVGYDYSLTTAAGTPAQSTGTPTVTGAATQGATLTATAGTWTAVGTIAYQWQRSGTFGWENIAGATSASYVPAFADLGDQLRVVVSDTGPAGQSTAASSPTAAVTVAAPINVTAPDITGALSDGSLLAATPGTWSPDGAFSYQWERCDATGADCQPIAGATAATFSLTPADVGSDLEVQVTATSTAAATSATSAPAGPIAEVAPVNTVAPQVTGTATQGMTLSAGAGTWSPSGSITYQWQRCTVLSTDCQDIPGATAATYTTGYDDANQRVRVLVTESNGAGATRAPSGAYGPVTPLSPQPLTWPSVDGTTEGTPYVGSAVTADPGTWNTPVTFSDYQWQRCDTSFQNCQEISGATSASYTPTSADLGSTLRYTATAGNSVGTVSLQALPTQPVTAAPTAPVNTTLPSIAGTVQRAQTLTANPGVWSPDGAHSFQWESCDATGANCRPIAGATAATYVSSATAVGHDVTVAVTATNSAGATTVTSTPVGPVADLAPTALRTPAITGTAAQGQLLASDSGVWSPTGLLLTEAWERCDASGASCLPIAGATGGSYATAAADGGHTLRLAVTGTTSAGSVTSVSPAFGPIPYAAPVDTAGPQVTGTPAEGQTLTVSDGTWDEPVSLRYQWQRCDAAGVTCQAIAGATAAAYTATGDDVGHPLQVAVTASAHGVITTVTSPVTSAVLPLAPVNTAAPQITGTTVEGQTLSTSDGLWNASVTTAYQWQRCDATGQNCQAIAGATASTYTLTAADVGADIAVTVTATNGAGHARTTSPAVGTVIALPPVNATAPSIAGTAEVGRDLTVVAGRWSPDGVHSYGWERCDHQGNDCQGLAGATTTDYMPSPADVGDTLRVVETVTNSGGAQTSVSAPTAPVADVPAVVASPPPTIRTAPRIALARGGRAVTVAGGIYTATTSISVQFFRCAPACTAVGPAGTEATHVLTAADAGAFMRATIRLHGPGGASAVRWVSGTAGPITGAHVAMVALTPARAIAVRTPSGTTPATARMTRPAPLAASVAVTRAPTASGALVAYVCAVSARGLDACTGSRPLSRQTLTLRLTLPGAAAGDRIELVVEPAPPAAGTRAAARAQSPSSARRRTTNS